MKRILIVLAAVAVAAVMAGVGFAAANGTIFNRGGLRCESKPQSTVVCALTGDSRGDYGVAINSRAVLVMRFDSDGTSHVVYKHLQPMYGRITAR